MCFLISSSDSSIAPQISDSSEPSGKSKSEEVELQQCCLVVFAELTADLDVF